MSGRFGMVALETVESKYLEGRTALMCSDATATSIDEEVRNTIGTCYADAERMLRENIDVLREAAEFLITKETITGKQFMEIFRRVRGEETAETAVVESIDLEAGAEAGEEKEEKKEFSEE